MRILTPMAHPHTWHYPHQISEHSPSPPSLTHSLTHPPNHPHPHSVLHDSSPTGKPSALAQLLARTLAAAEAGSQPQPHGDHGSGGSNGLSVRVHQQRPKHGVVVDPDTLEPQHPPQLGGGGGHDADDAPARGNNRGETSTLLLDSGLDVGLSLDLLRHSAKAGVVVVVSNRPELAESLQHVAEEEGQQGGKAVYVCAVRREVVGTPLERWCKDGATLERVLASAAEVLWTKGRPRSSSARNDHHGRLCSKGSACAHVKGTSGDGTTGGKGANGGSNSPRPFTAHKISHLCEFRHPCGRGVGCAAVGPLHAQAFIHPHGHNGNGNGDSSRSCSSCGRPSAAHQHPAPAALHSSRHPLQQHQQPAAAAVAPLAPPLPQHAPQPLKPTGSGSLLWEMAMEGYGQQQQQKGYCLSPVSKAARQASLWWQESRQRQQQQQEAYASDGEEDDVLGGRGEEHGAIFPMDL